MLLTRHYIVMDTFGDPLRLFTNYKDAKEFIINKPDCKIIRIKLDLNEFDEAPF